MTRFWDEVRIISRWAWLIATLAYAGLAALLWAVAIPRGQYVKHWPMWGQLLFVVGVPIALFAHVLLLGYIASDAKRRGMRYVMWTFLAVLLPDLIGVILYFVLRDPMPVTCPQCGTSGKKNFAFCPKCGTELSPACPVCKHTIERGWANCAYCGARIGGGAKSA
jgi:hypothetical protein